MGWFRFSPQLGTFSNRKMEILESNTCFSSHPWDHGTGGESLESLVGRELGLSAGWIKIGQPKPPRANGKLVSSFAVLPGLTFWPSFFGSRPNFSWLTPTIFWIKCRALLIKSQFLGSNLHLWLKFPNILQLRLQFRSTPPYLQHSSRRSSSLHQGPGSQVHPLEGPPKTFGRVSDGCKPKKRARCCKGQGVVFSPDLIP